MNPLLKLVIAIPLCGALVAGMLATAWLALGSPNPAAGATWFQLTKVGDSQVSGAPDQPFFFLILGNDGRSDADKGLGDAIHVVGVNPATHTASILNVPRDTQAPSGDKINAYHSLGGLPSIVEQLNKMMGINITYALTTNFPNFIAMVDEIGGIDVTIPPITDKQDSKPLGGDQTWNDSFTGAAFTPGPQHIDGTQALAFSRDRHDFNLLGDIARSGDQAIVILAALATLRAQNPGDAGTVKLVATLAKHVRTDNVSLTDMFRLGRLGLSIDPTTIKAITVPVGSGAGTNLQLTGDAQGLFQDFADDGVLQTH
jgi:polyisoprenyl-teichoic acid--peptidoglycan teichoic acid transferase